MQNLARILKQLNGLIVKEKMFFVFFLAGWQNRPARASQPSVLCTYRVRRRCTLWMH